MSPDHKQLARRWFEEIWNRRNDGVFDELSSPDTRGYLPTGEAMSPSDFRVTVAQFFAAFPDLVLQVESVIGDGDETAVRWRATATHTGTGFGLPPTGKRHAFRGITWFRFQEGRILEAWDCWNQSAVFQAMREGTDCEIA